VSRLSTSLVVLAAAALFPPPPPWASSREPPPDSPAATIWHLGHSGVAVETLNHLLIFDYSDDWPVGDARRGLAAGVVEPNEIADRRVVVFISHEHHDHFWPDAIDWLERIPDLRFVVSPEVSQADRRFAARAGVVDVLAPETGRRVGDLRVETLRSTDSGVAFVVEVDALTIYHSGDHAAFNWSGDEDAPARFVEERLGPLHGRSIDIAFQVADPRLSDAGWGGTVAFARRLEPRLLVPVHMKRDYSRMGELGEELRRSGFRGEFWQVSRRGESRTCAVSPTPAR
jgi:L-ascorbate metabolism protein UlaG (beta-lactamase superfamily)